MVAAREMVDTRWEHERCSYIRVYGTLILRARLSRYCLGIIHSPQ
jgi:hypothetical protein